MRVLQLHNHQSAPGGALEVLHHEAAVLASGGHDVEQLTVAAAGDQELSALRAGAKAVWNIEASRHTRQWIRRFRPDVVHVHTPFPIMSPAVFRVAAAEKVPAVTTLHSYRWACVVGTCVRDGRICEDCVGSRLKLPGVRHACYHDSHAASAALTLSLGLHRAIGTTHHSVSRYLTLTDFMRRLMIRDGYPADRIEVKPNSVPDPGPGQGSGGARREVVFAARLVEVKGVRTLLDAWQAAAPDLRLVIAGDGELRPEVEAAAAADPSIEFLGWVDEAVVTQRMRDALAVVLPSQWYEGLPLVILRSLAVGTPLLVSDLDNICEDIVRDGTGWSFRVGDVGDLAAHLRRLSDEPEAAERLRERARLVYEKRYSPAENLRALERIYEDVAQGRPAASSGATAQAP